MNRFQCKIVFLLFIISEKNHWVTIIQNFVLVLYIFTFSKNYKLIGLYKTYFILLL